MVNRSVLVFIVLISVILIAGIYLKEAGTPENTIESDSIPITNLPPGFTYMGIHETSIDINGLSVNGLEGVYRYSSGDDVYIQVIENDTPETLVNQYKMRYKDANYDPFQEIFFNDHPATMITDYHTINSQQRASYSIIWAAADSLIIVGSSNDQSAVRALAAATGH